MIRKKYFLSITLSLLISLVTLAQPKYEFRAAWIATVDNIDWPTRGNVTTEGQKQEFIRILDMHKRNGMNAVIVQIRPATDAFYPSVYEPWSQWLTGKQGQAPAPYYDPLRFMIDEAHKRGMEFHAWCNPYRAEFAIARGAIAPDHVTKRFPEWFLTYGTQKFFDPGNKEGQQFVVKVVRDIVSRYNIDAIHFDDYFYPYRIAGKEFPDDASYKKYGNGLSKDDWRRSNVDSIILMLSNAIKEENPDCRFGISPFCVWRNSSQDPEGSPTKAGMNNYDDLYADILLWLKEGWIDYVAPQLYLEFEHKAVPYEVILDWWSKHTYGKHCYIGLGIYKAGSNVNWKKKDQIPRMINSARAYPEIQGAIYFSSKSFENNPNGWSDSLRNNYYRYPALIPSMEWIDTTKPMKPIVVKVAGTSAAGSVILNIQNPIKSKAIKTFVVYSFLNDDKIRDTEDPRNIVQLIPTTSDASFVIQRSGNENRVFAVSSIDTNNNESELAIIE